MLHPRTADCGNPIEREVQPAVVGKGPEDVAVGGSPGLYLLHVLGPDVVRPFRLLGGRVGSQSQLLVYLRLEGDCSNEAQVEMEEQSMKGGCGEGVEEGWIAAVSIIVLESPV